MKYIKKYMKMEIKIESSEDIGRLIEICGQRAADRRWHDRYWRRRRTRNQVLLAAGLIAVVASAYAYLLPQNDRPYVAHNGLSRAEAVLSHADAINQIV